MKTLLTGLAVFGACGAVRRRLERDGGSETVCAGGHIHLTTLRNARGAFGLRLPRTAILALSGTALCAAWLLRRRHPLGAGLLLGGGGSNVWERLRRGAVYDYIRFPKAPGRLKRYVFNLADFAIFAGSLLLTLGGRNGR